VSRAVATDAAIVAANAALLARLGIDPAEAATTCWGCRVDALRGPQRVHVVARTHGGSDAPDNFFILCWLCHRDQPDGVSRATQEAWLIRRESFFALASREWDGTIRAFIDAAVALYGQAAFDAFVGGTSWGEFEALLRAGAEKAAGTNPHTRTVNALWSLMERVRAFAQKED